MGPRIYSPAEQPGDTAGLETTLKSAPVDGTPGLGPVDGDRVCCCEEGVRETCVLWTHREAQEGGLDQRSSWI